MNKVFNNRLKKSKKEKRFEKRFLNSRVCMQYKI